ncbi:hypothetical protein [Rhodalgimonas zhirmunskyi]|uniref:Methionyl-tRNA formyltransferase n=1 Tax=Rhodalgimonas zhirmunskyi TaxID=2964767 RepID=A0AAJ1X7F1_9RHOB|nr:hypothetical protein [Rhodoalgimonas zhirmunskyi]MDQ2094447.1 hypothetical protein [Rhodoalgimonas zhirmunskyi]
MALVLSFEKKDLEHASKQKPVEATYSTFDLDGEQFFQIDTYGSSDRKLVGKRSQSIRLNRESASRLIDLLQQEFSLD